MTAILMLAGCGGNEEKDERIDSVDEAYQKATKSIQHGNYRRGIQILEAIQARLGKSFKYGRGRTN